MKRTSVAFSPLHGLASLGAGGLAVSFFVWLMFLTPHPNSPVPTFESLALARSVAEQTGWITFVSTMIAVLALAHYGLLAWWLVQGARLTDDQRHVLLGGEAHIFKMITPLVLAMSVNAGFAIALVFIPGLWGLKEYLFPLALLAFAILFVLASKRWFAQQVLSRSQQLSYRGKGLIELLAAFAFAMITVGFSASAAMSDTTWIHTSGTILAITGAAMALWAGVHVLRQRMASLRHHPVAAAATGSLLMGVPILTVLGIAGYRLMMASQHHFGMVLAQGFISATLALIFMAQVLIFVMATPTLLRRGGWRTLVAEQPQGASFSLICPGVGLFVLGMFLVSNGLIPLGWLNTQSAAIAYTGLGLIQAVTLGLFIYLLLKAMPTKFIARQPKQVDPVTAPLHGSH